MTPLLIATVNQNFEVFSYLCSLKDVDVNCSNFSKMTPIHFCAKCSLFEYVKILINHEGIILNPKDTDNIFFFQYFLNKTPLDLAERYRQNEMVTFLTKVYEEKNLLNKE